MRAFRVSPCVLGLFGGLSVLTLTLSGCGRRVSPVAPDAPPPREEALRAGRAGSDGLLAGAQVAGSFYPLQIGNHWGYEHEISFYIVPTGGQPGPVSSVRDRHERDLVCVEPLAGRRYVVEQTSYGGSLFSWVRYRQDGTGLYEADLNIGEPPVCVGPSGQTIFDGNDVPAGSGEGAWAPLAAKLPALAQRVAYRAAWHRIQARAAAVRRALEPGSTPAADGGVEPGEITRLAYPLHPGAHWVIRASPRFESFVERADALDLAVGHVPAWRIRLEVDSLGENDSIHFWYGRDGFLKLVAHFEDAATDASGNIIGVVIGDESELLDELSLQGGHLAAR